MKVVNLAAWCILQPPAVICSSHTSAALTFISMFVKHALILLMKTYEFFLECFISVSQLWYHDIYRNDMRAVIWLNIILSGFY